MEDLQKLPKGNEKGKAPTSGTSKGKAMDFSTVKPFDPLPERDENGKVLIYPCVIFNIETGKKGPKGEYDVVDFEVQGPEKYKKRRLFRNYSTTEQSLPFYMELLTAANKDADLGSDFVMSIEEWVGLPVGIGVENETYDEQIRSRVKRVYPASKANIS